MFKLRSDKYYGENGWSSRKKSSNTMVTQHLEPDVNTYSVGDFISKVWPKMTGKEMDDLEKTNLKAGCVGITSAVLRESGVGATRKNGGYSTLGLAMEARSKMQLTNPKSKYIIYSVRFYSADSEKLLPNKEGFVNMSGWNYNDRIAIGRDVANFDFGYLDEPSGLWWHANAVDEPVGNMKIFNSTLYKYSQEYEGFNRQIFVVASLLYTK